MKKEFILVAITLGILFLCLAGLIAYAKYLDRYSRSSLGYHPVEINSFQNINQSRRDPSNRSSGQTLKS